ncbi:hypothetical protein C7974DRAFT_194875 [Boeremia exigua]|uniref:uncharacterized protein n=1 Tax=Boeremia exigua TaxID=749465 RepID=UPI001E8CB281|nr:uncharacterized protein C7974DRAFT_194875 [Boeremia exigua]KAH6625100.1 hypothetical protein C7974DRAFT_194875 [Boeremia exigua]
MPGGNKITESHARRSRPTISCRECHRRKQKCDRRQPCVHCMKRGKSVCYRLGLCQVANNIGCLSLPTES